MTVRRATIHDVAREAGVSRSTVSRAISGTGYVAAEVRDRVREAAARLGYVPDEAARSLKLQESSSIGVLVSDLENSFYAELAAGIGSGAESRGNTMILVDDRGSIDAELRAVASFVAMRVRGVIATPLSAELASALAERGIPLVEVDRQFAAATCDAVIGEDRESARALTLRLIDAGHRRIALLVDETDWTTGRDRVAGFLDAHAAAGLDADRSLIVPTGWDREAATAVASELLSRADAPTAVFAANNVLAEGAWRAARDAGRAVPASMSLVSFDDAPWMSMVEPGVTVAAQSPRALGLRAIELLEERIAAPAAPPRHVVLPATILDRGSIAPPASR